MLNNCDPFSDDLVAQGEQFDVVCSLEVIEHVSNVPAFLHSLTPLVKVSLCPFYPGAGASAC